MRHPVRGAFLAVLVVFALAGPSWADVPANLEELRAIEKQAVATADAVIPATVGLQLMQGSGSGIIVSPDGYIATAAHVIGQPGQPVRIVMADGSLREGVTLGVDSGADYGLVKMKDGEDLPFAVFGDSASTKAGEWVLATGHPFGVREGRPPVLRIGRVISHQRRVIQTDCPLISGDSGGPLFTLDGKLIGIHSYIGQGPNANYHIPANFAWEAMDRLIEGDRIGGTRGMFESGPRGPFLGVQTESVPPADADELGIDGGVRVIRVLPDTAAAEAGLAEGDIIVRFGDRDVRDTNGFVASIRRHKSGDKIPVVVWRNGERLTIQVTMGER